MANDGKRVKITYTTTDPEALAAFHETFDRQLEEAKGRLGERHPTYAGHAERWGESEFEDQSPSDTRLVLGRFQEGDAGDVEAAVAAARRAFPAWSRVPYTERIALLRRAADILSERNVEWAVWVALEVGKNRLEALAEVEEAADLIRYYCSQMERHEGYEEPMGPGTPPKEHTRSVLRPYGVFAVVSPFNFPMALAMGMSAGALVGGNTVVFKPASDAPLSGIALYHALRQAGLPEGAFSFLTGSGREVGTPLVNHPDVAGIAFTGSRAVGMSVVRRAAEGRHPRPCIAEMGGKNPVIVTRHADLEAAAEGTMRSAFGYSGQKCSAASRVYVEESVKEAFLERLVEMSRQLIVGDPTRRETYMGPLVNHSAYEGYQSYVEQARRDGGRFLQGGQVLDEGDLRHGYYVAPTIIDGLPRDHQLIKEELFVPILCTVGVESLEDAIQEANAVEYGLCAGIFSRDEGEIETFFQRIEAGVTYSNRRAGATTGAWPGVQSFGGWKYSGSSGKSALGPWYVPQFMHEQSQTRVEARPPRPPCA